MDAVAPAPIDTAALLPDLWYFAMPGRTLARGRMLAKTLASQPLLFARTQGGEPFALLDICPHRGIPLHHGSFDGAEVECCYHGWRFDQTGRCTAIPSLVEGQEFDLARIKVRRFPCREVQGNIWVFLGRDESVAPPIPVLPEIGERPAQLIERVDFPCHVDHAVVGLMDPAHGPFVHTSWWWRSRTSIHAKTKNFAASELGFRMTRHEPSSNSLAYRILGGGISTEISFRLPGIRIEHIKAGRYTVVGLTAVTPIDDTRTELHQVFYWTAPWLSALRPLLRPIARTFLNQDRDIVVKQQEGLKHKPNLMLINDADMPAKWYYRLKREWLSARQENRAFENPVRDAVLKWRS